MAVGELSADDQNSSSPAGTPADAGPDWRTAAEQVRRAAAAFGQSGNAATARELAVASELLTSLGAAAAGAMREPLRDAADSFRWSVPVAPVVTPAPPPDPSAPPAGPSSEALLHLFGALMLMSAARNLGGDDAHLEVVVIALLALMAVIKEWHLQQRNLRSAQAAARAAHHLQHALDTVRGAAGPHGPDLRVGAPEPDVAGTRNSPDAGRRAPAPAAPRGPARGRRR